jgi:uncharacterized protein YqhQ
MSQEKEIIVGGQAVIEGVMMRAPNSYAVAVRRQDGSIVSKSERLPKLADKYPILKTPVLRGSAVLIHWRRGEAARRHSSGGGVRRADGDRSRDRISEAGCASSRKRGET